MRRLILGAMLWCLTAASANEPTITVVLPLNHAKAAEVLRWLPAESEGEPWRYNPASELRLLHPANDADWAEAVMAQLFDGSRRHGTPLLEVPDGVFERPAGLRELRAIDEVNALVARGTTSSVEELKRLIALLDVPRQPIRIDWFVADLRLSSIEDDELSGRAVRGGSVPDLAFVPSEFAFDALRQRWETDPEAIMTRLDPALLRTDVPAVAEWRDVQSPSLPEGWVLDEPLTAPVKVLVHSRVTGVPGRYSVTASFNVVLTKVLSLLEEPGFAVAPLLSKNGYSSTLRLADRGTMIIGLPIRGSGAEARRSLLVIRPSVWRDSEPAE